MEQAVGWSGGGLTRLTLCSLLFTNGRGGPLLLRASLCCEKLCCAGIWAHELFTNTKTTYAFYLLCFSTGAWVSVEIQQSAPCKQMLYINACFGLTSLALVQLCCSFQTDPNPWSANICIQLQPYSVWKVWTDVWTNQSLFKSSCNTTVCQLVQFYIV